ncbi:hypothetical protein M0804_006441 [Polistes exclamans]|nr:hypothetical protein M0804_006441 [Polistes exclamans]
MSTENRSEENSTITEFHLQYCINAAHTITMLPTPNRDTVSQDNYISLEEAKKMIPMFDGHNLDPYYFIEICQRVNSRLDPKHRKELNNILRTKIFGELRIDLSATDYDIRTVLRVINETIEKSYSSSFKINNLIDNLNRCPDCLKKCPLSTWTNFSNKKLIRFLEFYDTLPNCTYCLDFNHTTENHCCSFLKTNKPLTFAEQNLLSRRQFLHKLFKREIGL